MSQDDRSTSRKDEYLGVALFLLGVVPLVLVLTALMREPDPTRGTTAMQTAALALIDAFGAVPCLLAGLGMAGIGGWIFAGNPLAQPSRHLLGVGGAAMGLAVLLGAFDDAWGGRLGLKTGGALATVTPVLGGLAGALVILGSAYVAWLHGRIELPARKPRKVATLGDALSEKDADGVSVAESNALVPDASTLDYMEDLWASGHQRVQKVPMPPSPYPEDVRLQGGVPEGASVLRTDDEEDDAELEDLDLAHRWERADPEAYGSEPAGEDLAGGGMAGGAHGHGRPQGRPLDADESEEVAIARLLSAPAGEPLADHEPAPASPTPLTRALDDAAPSAGGVPRPSWELDDEVELGEPVPLVVDPEPEAELEDEDLEEEDPEAAEYEEEEDSEEEDEAAEYEEADDEDEDAEESEAAEYEEEDEDEESDAEAAEYDEEEDSEEEPEAAADDDADDDAEEEAELDEAEVEAALDEADEELAAEVEEELLDELEQELAEEAAEEEAEAPVAEAEEAPEEPAAETEPEVILEPAPAPKARKSRAKTPAKTPAKSRAAAPEPAPEGSDPEPDPAPAPKRSGRGSKKAAAQAAAEASAPAPAATATLVAALGDRADLVRKCGALFLEQGRVAVSLLQRQFDLDFEQACEILDDLQELGLIGPYMGGQQRDILLDAREWQERMSAS